jgi:uncharacterized damage-inducible protein DinB
MSYSLQQHLAYNIWANGKIAEFIGKVDEKLFDAEVKSSFPSLRKTVYHVWDAEFIWLKRLQGTSLSDWPSKQFTGNREEALKGWADCSKNLFDFIVDKDQSYYESVLTYKSVKGDEYKTPVDGIIMHVVNHGTFHRGQLVTMLRELGYTDLSSTDLVTFYRL